MAQHDILVSAELFERMQTDHTWRDFQPREDVKVGDVLKVTSPDEMGAQLWEVTEEQAVLTPEQAREEWAEDPFCSEAIAKAKGYYAYVIRNLRKIEREGELAT